MTYQMQHQSKSDEYLKKESFFCKKNWDFFHEALISSFQNKFNFDFE